jgi:hypothetical protein
MRALGWLLLFSSVAFAQSVPKTGVKFVCTCTDTVGARYATAVRDLIATSPRYKPAAEFIEGPENSKIYNMGIRVTSLDPQVGNPGNGSALAITITWGALYMTNYIQICPSRDVQTCAANTIADLDSQLN